MEKLFEYFKTGKGHGLRLVLCASLLIAMCMGGMIWYLGKSFVREPLVMDFVNSVPSFSIKNGVIENPNLKWAAIFPETDVPIVIDTTQETLIGPVPDGVYFTRSKVYRVSEHGTQISTSSFDADVAISPEYLHKVLERVVWIVSIVLGVIAFAISWLSFLTAVVLSALVGLIVRASFENGRLWRVTAVTWVLAQLIGLTLSILGVVISWWFIFILALFNGFLLKKITE